MSGHGDYSLLTEKQTELLEFLLSEQDIGNGFPSFVRMACHVGFFSDGSVERALNALRWAGFVRKRSARKNDWELAGPTRSLRPPSGPTQEAYDAVCKALWHWREEAARLGRICGETPREMNYSAASENQSDLIEQLSLMEAAEQP
jgi:hypothetical protein